MILQLCILWLTIFLSPLVPPILSPLGYSLIGVSLAQQVNPRMLSFIAIGISTLATICIWVLQNYIIENLTIYKEDKDPALFSRIARKINTYFRKQERITKIGLEWHEYLKTRTGRFATFIFAIFCYLPILPDIIGTRILYKKMSFASFIVAVIIGKSITYIPFIFLGKALIQIVFT